MSGGVRTSQAAEGTATFPRHRSVTDAGLFGNNDLTRAVTPIAPLPSPFASSQGPAPAAPSR
jgi:hypothetical protein